MIVLEQRLDEDIKSFLTLMQPHWQQTRERIEAHSCVLLVQDRRNVGRLSHPDSGHLNHESNERRLFLQTALAVLPEQGDVLGCAMQECFVHTPTPPGETRNQRSPRPHERDMSRRLVQRLGRFPQRTTIVHVGDTRADTFPFFQICRSYRTHFLVQAAQNRRIQEEDGRQAHLLDEVRAWPAQQESPLEMPSPWRTSTRGQLVFGKTAVLPPCNEKQASQEPLEVCAIRIWDEQSPAGQEPLEWILLTSLPITTCEQACQCVRWYAHRWIVHDYHACLETGYRLAEQGEHQADGVLRRLGLLSPLAVRLVQLRTLAYAFPAQPARELIEADVVAIVAAYAGQPFSLMTTHTFWKSLERMGGRLRRQGDDPVDWKLFWKGWLRVQTLLTGARWNHPFWTRGG